MMRASFVRLVGVVFLAWISAQSAVLAQSADDVAALSAQVIQLNKQGKYKEATELAEQALSLAERVFGPEHPSTLASVGNLGFLYRAQGRYGEAEPLYKRALAGTETTLGPEHLDTLRSVNNLAALYQAAEKPGG